MSNSSQWMIGFGESGELFPLEGLVPVADFNSEGCPPEVVSTMEKARHYGAAAVFFEATRNDRPPVPQAFIFVSDGPAKDRTFAEIHKRLWSWGGVPLVYRRTPGLIQLFRCAHKPDFVSRTGELICKPVKTLRVAARVANDPWWDPVRLRNGTLWDDPAVCKVLLSAEKAAHKRLIDAIADLNDYLNEEKILEKHLRRKLLILSLLIAYLEEREVLQQDYFDKFLKGSTKFFEVLADGDALVELLADLEQRLNGNIFKLSKADREALKGNKQLAKFSKLIEAREEIGGQLTLWQLYSFEDLPVELISHIYQIFVDDANSSVYTPPFLVRLILEETLSWERLNRIEERNEIILDPCCGSGVFLVEAYKRLILHWRSRNQWRRPPVHVVQALLKKVHGIDLEGSAVELAAFSLCLALCDTQERETIWTTQKLFPPLAGDTLHNSCFFEAKEKGLIKANVGVVTGNPPFTSILTTQGAKRSYENYTAQHGSLPDKQLAYLFLNDAMEVVTDGGVLGMLQQYNFLYNQGASKFRRNFIERWDVREVLDFISVRGLFTKGGADTKVVVVVPEAITPPPDRKILHATFRRSGRVNSEQGFVIDYYDLHWLPRGLAISNDSIWRANLLGGTRVLAFVDRLRSFRTVGQFADRPGWDVGEGFIAGDKEARQEGPHLTGKPVLEPHHLREGVQLRGLKTVTATRFKSAYTRTRFQSPMLLIHEHEDLTARLFLTGYYAYKHKIAGFPAPQSDTDKLTDLAQWLKIAVKPLQAFVTAGGTTTFTQKASWVGLTDIKALPFPETNSLELSANELILVDDIVDFYREYIRRGEDSSAMKEGAQKVIGEFANVFIKQINTIYKKNPLSALEPYFWSGVACQPFVFGNTQINWTGAHELEGKLDRLLREQRGDTLTVTRIARIYDGAFVFLLKPDRAVYWLRSTALRDADDVLADLRAEGF